MVFGGLWFRCSRCLGWGSTGWLWGSMFSVHLVKPRRPRRPPGFPSVSRQPKTRADLLSLQSACKSAMRVALHEWETGEVVQNEARRKFGGEEQNGDGSPDRQIVAFRTARDHIDFFGGSASLASPMLALCCNRHFFALTMHSSVARICVPRRFAFSNADCRTCSKRWQLRLPAIARGTHWRWLTAGGSCTGHCRRFTCNQQWVLPS